MMRRSIVFLACPLLFFSAAAFAKTTKPAKSISAAAAATVPKARAVHTRHSVNIDGRTIHYTATAGTLILKNKKDQPIASVFYIAYTKNGANSDRRPVTFAYNGGPGFASALVDIGGFGPMRILWPAPGDTAAQQPPYQLVPNQYSILKSTDIVFIDAIGTGYSRIVGKGKPKDVYGVKEDGTAFKRFVEQWLSRNHRWNSPKFLLGESYGTTRNAVLANDLVNDGVYLNGVIMCSTVLQFSTINAVPGNDLPFISYLPSYAAVAWYHHRLDPMPPSLPKFVHKVEQFAGGPYAHALFEGAALSQADKDAIAAKLAGYTGIPESLWLKANLRMTLSVFRRNVMGNDTMTGRYDERFTTYQLQPLLPFPGRDSLGATTSAYLGALTATMNRYVSQTLKFHSDRPYVQSSYSVFKAWDWKYKTQLSGLSEGVGNSGAFESPNVAPALARAMSNDPDMQLMMNNGYFDTATPFFATVYTVRHMGLPKPLHKNIHWHYYPVGHMLYLNPKALPKVDANIDTFIEHAAGEHSDSGRG